MRQITVYVLSGVLISEVKYLPVYFRLRNILSIDKYCCPLVYPYKSESMGFLGMLMFDCIKLKYLAV